MGGIVLVAFLGVAIGGALKAIPELALIGGLAVCCSSSALLWACYNKEKQNKIPILSTNEIILKSTIYRACWCFSLARICLFLYILF